MEDEHFTEIPNNFNSSCFGCSPSNPMGLQMTFKAGEETVISELTVPEHLCGWSRLVHGGVITTILDEIMSWSAIYFMKSLVMTKEMKITFLKSLYVGEELQAVGRIVEKIDRHTVLLKGELYNQKRVLCAASDATFAVFSLKLAKRMGISQDELPDWLKHPNLSK